MRTALALATLVTVLAARPAAGLVIVPTFDASITSDPNSAQIQATILQAINVYQTRFSDPITVTITFQNMSSGLGQSSWWYYTFPYSTFRAALAADASTASDTTALAHLPTGTNNPVNGTASVRLKTANIRALGIAGNFPSGAPGGADGIIGLNIAICNITRVNINPSKYDLQAVCMHEIDEILGLSSGLDFGTATGNPLPQDMFRYNAAHARAYALAGDDAYFSIDGAANLARFNQGGGGDYGDWWSCSGCPHTPQVQDAFGSPGTTPNIGVELTALDVIGYNLVPACTCRADFNCSGQANVQDIFDFLTAWFTGNPRADFNGVNGIGIQDIFDFLSNWFHGC